MVSFQFNHHPYKIDKLAKMGDKDEFDEAELLAELGELDDEETESARAYV